MKSISAAAVSSRTFGGCIYSASKLGKVEWKSFDALGEVNEHVKVACQSRRGNARLLLAPTVMLVGYALPGRVVMYKFKLIPVFRRI